MTESFGSEQRRLRLGTFDSLTDEEVRALRQRRSKREAKQRPCLYPEERKFYDSIGMVPR